MPRDGRDVLWSTRYSARARCEDEINFEIDINFEIEINFVIDISFEIEIRIQYFEDPQKALSMIILSKVYF